ncbi:hypothetical protein ACFV2U_09985 [Streptomyces sp. NPDC059697]|uniref:hypothetical protein n=1 Tax=Streptomyces sp. NPDC059697 TaxID=3346912 RepID=UPI0036A8F0DD
MIWRISVNCRQAAGSSRCSPSSGHSSYITVRVYCSVRVPNRPRSGCGSVRLNQVIWSSASVSVYVFSCARERASHTPTTTIASTTA